MFYLPLCNHSLKMTSNYLSLNVLPWLQMPRFICNHLQPSATLVLFLALVLFVAEAATLLVATLLVAPSVNLQVRVADEQSFATLSATL